MKLVAVKSGIIILLILGLTGFIYIVTAPQYIIVSDPHNLSYRNINQDYVLNGCLGGAFDVRRAIQIAERALREVYDIRELALYQPYSVFYDKSAKLWIIQGPNTTSNDATIITTIKSFFVVIDKPSGAVITSHIGH